MTPTEREKKIRELLNDPWGNPIANDVVEGVIKWIAAEIEAVRKEAFEEAAKIAERCWENSKEYEGASIALAVRDSIRRRAAEGEK
jgi:hypothetical protein